MTASFPTRSANRKQISSQLSNPSFCYLISSLTYGGVRYPTSVPRHAAPDLQSLAPAPSPYHQALWHFGIWTSFVVWASAFGFRMYLYLSPPISMRRNARMDCSISNRYSLSSAILNAFLTPNTQCVKYGRDTETKWTMFTRSRFQRMHQKHPYPAYLQASPTTFIILAFGLIYRYLCH